jgi:hypothetical protein
MFGHANNVDFIVDLQEGGLFRYNKALQKATLRSSDKSQSLFENNINNLQMFGKNSQSFNQSIVQGNL